MFRKNFRSLAIVLSLALVLAQGAVFAPGASAQQQQRGPLSFRTLEGGQVSSESWRGQVVVLAFGASWLPLCRAQAEGLQRLSDQYAGRAQFFWVSTEADAQGARNFASADQLRAFARRHQMQVTILRDPNGAISRQLGVDQIPAVVLLDRQGNISGTPIGGSDTRPDADLAAQIAPKLDRLLN